MKKIIFLLAGLLVSGTTVFAQNKWIVDKAHSRVSFSVRHMMMSDVDGNFRKFEAWIISSKPDFSDAVFEVKIEAASINTENETRDNDLKSEKYFDVTKYPEITFKSTAVSKSGGDSYKVTGNLTMHGVTKQVTLELTLNGTGTN